MNLVNFITGTKKILQNVCSTVLISSEVVNIDDR